MPELPEVETVVQSLKPFILKKQLQLINYSVHNISNIDKESIKKLLESYYVHDIERRGKYIIIKFADLNLINSYNQEEDKICDFQALVHLRMTGKLICNTEKTSTLKHSHLSFKITDLLKKEKTDYQEKNDTQKQLYLHFNDTRRFGRFDFNAINGQKEKLKSLFNIELPEKAALSFENLGPEPLSDAFNLVYLKEKISQHRKLNLKTFLLRQDIIAGLGNIYADEICFASALLPDTIIGTLKNKDLDNIINNCRNILQQSIKNRGTTFRDYVDASQQKGNNQNFLKVYGRGGKSCPICLQKLHKMKCAGRTTVYCPNCQR